MEFLIGKLRWGFEVKEITVIETSDGKLFKNVAEARKHEFMLSLKDRYESDSIYADYCKVDFETVCEWLLRNQTTVLEFLKGG